MNALQHLMRTVDGLGFRFHHLDNAILHHHVPVRWHFLARLTPDALANLDQLAAGKDLVGFLVGEFPTVVARFFSHFGGGKMFAVNKNAIAIENNELQLTVFAQSGRNVCFMGRGYGHGLSSRRARRRHLTLFALRVGAITKSCVCG